MWAATWGAAVIAVTMLVSGPLSASADTSVSVNVGSATSSTAASVHYVSIQRLGNSSRYKATGRGLGVGQLTLSDNGTIVGTQVLDSPTVERNYEFVVRLVAGEHVLTFTAADASGLTTAVQSTTVTTTAPAVPESEQNAAFAPQNVVFSTVQNALRFDDASPLGTVILSLVALCFALLARSRDRRRFGRATLARHRRAA